MAPAGLAVPVVQVLVGPVVLARAARAIPAMVTAVTAQGATNLAAPEVTAVTGPAAQANLAAPEDRAAPVDMIQADRVAPVSPAVQDLAGQANPAVPAGMIRADLAGTTQVVRVPKAQVRRVAQALKLGRVLPGLMPTGRVPTQEDPDLMPAEPGRTCPADRVQTPVDRRRDPTARAAAICPAAVTCPAEGTPRAGATPAEAATLAAAGATPAVVADPRPWSTQVRVRLTRDRYQFVSRAVCRSR